MLVILPVASILMLISRKTIRESIFLSLVINGLFIAVSTEILSLLGALTLTGVVVSWLLFIAGTLYMRRRIHRWFGIDTTPGDESHSFADKTMLAVLATLIALLGFVAVMAAPNNWDSLTYHLPRILHWIQNGSVAHYPTHITRQLTMPPWSEYAMMHLFLLSGGDQFVNCIQWLSMVGSCIGVTLIVKKMGGALSRQYAAALIAITLPIGLLEATSTQNDYALAAWSVAVLVYTLDATESLTWQATLLCSVSLAMALMTKGTGYIILFPVILGLFVILVKRTPFKSFAMKLAVGALIVLTLNGGVYLRNWTIFGSPLTTDGDSIVFTSPEPRLAFLAIIRSLGVHLASNINMANNALFSASSLAHKLVGVDLHDPRFVTGYTYRIFPYRNHEDYASNPLHMLLFLGAVISAVTLRNKLDRRVLWYVAVVSGSFISLSIMIRWNVWLSRYFVPVFILTAPAVVMTVPKIIPKSVLAITLVLLTGIGFYVATTNETRSLVGNNSILKRTRIDQYFANAPDLPTYYMQKLTKVAMTGFPNIAISKLNGDAWEYPIWIMLPTTVGRSCRIEHINVQNRSKNIPLKEGFSPYAELVL